MKTFKLYNKYKLYGIHNNKEDDPIQPVIHREMSNAKIVIPSILPMGNLNDTEVAKTILDSANSQTKLTNITKIL